jgi:hypothetical protein
MTEYRAKIEVTAARWNGNNLKEMKDLLVNIVDQNEFDGPEVYVDHIEPFYYSDQINREGYNMLKFYAGDDMEVDPGCWVVVYEDGEVEIMDDAQFIKMFTEK